MMKIVTKIISPPNLPQPVTKSLVTMETGITLRAHVPNVSADVWAMLITKLVVHPDWFSMLSTINVIGHTISMDVN